MTTLKQSACAHLATRGRVPDGFLEILERMKSSPCWTIGSSRKNVISAARRLFRWMASTGRTDVASLELGDVREFYLHRMGEVGNAAIARHNMKAAFRLLRESGLLAIDADPVFGLPVPTRHRLLPAFEQDALAAVLEHIDRSTPAGKRDYAFILTGASTGLRVSDIAAMKLRDIDWRKGVLDVRQRKTGRALSLPLMAGMGEALADYILNGRGECDAEEVFLSGAESPTPVTAGSMSAMFSRRCRAAGISRTTRDGLSFHSLRRMVGKSLVKGGQPVSMVSQVLGHHCMSAAEKYISMDVEGLRKCALDLSAVGLGGGLWS